MLIYFYFAQFKLPGFIIYRAICDILEGNGRVDEAIRCFRSMHTELTTEKSFYNERAQWELGRWLWSDAADACLSICCRFSTAMHRPAG